MVGRPADQRLFPAKSLWSTPNVSGGIEAHSVERSSSGRRQKGCPSIPREVRAFQTLRSTRRTWRTGRRERDTIKGASGRKGGPLGLLKAVLESLGMWPPDWRISALIAFISGIVTLVVLLKAEYWLGAFGVAVSLGLANVTRMSIAKYGPPG